MELELGLWWVGDAASATVDGDTLAGGAPSSCVVDLHSATATPPESRTWGDGGRGLATLRAAVARCSRRPAMLGLWERQGPRSLGVVST